MKRVIVMVAALMALQGCSDSDREATAPVVVTAAESGTIKPVELAERYVTSGTVTSDHRVSISSRISGYIRKLSVRAGDRVQRGQILVRVDPVNAKQAVVQAEADLADATADLNRYEALYRDRAASKQQLDRARLRYKVTKSQLKQARNQLGYAEVTAPVNGVVVEKRMNKGDLAAPGATILTIEDPASLLVSTYVSEQFVSLIHVGDRVDVEVPALKRTIAGSVRQVVEAADPVSHQFLVKVAVQHPDLHPGMFAQSAFLIGKRQALLIPAAAVIDRSGLHGVYLIDSDGVAHYRQIRIGNRVGEDVEVLAGLHAGDVIAWHGKPELKTGMRLKAQ